MSIVYFLRIGSNLVFCWGIFLQTYGQRLLQAVGDTVLFMVSLIIGAVVNIILDPIMIFGLLGCPAMGIRGWSRKLRMTDCQFRKSST